MPSLDCGCNIIVTVTAGNMALQAAHCALHGAAKELRDMLAELIAWAIATESLNGLKIDQIALYRECISRAKMVLARATEEDPDHDN